MLNLIKTIAHAICEVLGVCNHDVILPEYPIYTMTWKDMAVALERAGLTCMIKDEYPSDSFVYLTDFESLKLIFRNYIYSAALFTMYERRDCDNYAKKAIGNFEFDTGLTGLQLNGNVPDGRHAFCGALTNDGKLVIWEPNAGFLCAGELLTQGNSYGWEPDAWK